MKEIYKDYLFEKHILVSDEEKEEKLRECESFSVNLIFKYN